MIYQINGGDERRVAQWVSQMEIVLAGPRAASETMQKAGIPPEARHQASGESLAWRAGMILMAPLSLDTDALPPGLYAIVSDPEQELVRLAMAERDETGQIVASHREVVVARDRLDRLIPYREPA